MWKKLHPFTEDERLKLCFPQLHDQESRYVVESWCCSFISMFFFGNKKTSSQHWRMKLKLSWSSWNIYFPGKCSMSKKIWWSEIQKKWIPGNVLARCAGDGGFAVEWFPRSCPQPDRLVCPRGLWLLFFFVYSIFFQEKSVVGFTE